MKDFLTACGVLAALLTGIWLARGTAVGTCLSYIGMAVAYLLGGCAFLAALASPARVSGPGPHEPPAPRGDASPPGR